jgi:hypothetical protein
MNQDETNNLLSMTQNEASQVDQKTSSLMCCSAKLLCNASNFAFRDQSLCLQVQAPTFGRYREQIQAKLEGKGEFVHGVFVADHIKAKSRGGRLPDWKDCAVDMIAKGSSLGYVFLI